MDYSQSFAISAAGMAAEHTRLEVAALNLANANTMQTADGGAYQAMRVVMRAILPAAPSGDFAARMKRSENDPALATFAVPEASIEPSGIGPRQVYDAGNPFADDKGFINYPGVDTATEMVNMMSALRSYESNVAAMNMAKTMASRALEIGGSSS
jgi:flagellar basal-body rod protein FlgC